MLTMVRGSPVQNTEGITDMVDGIDFALRALNKRMIYCGEPELTRAQLEILVEIKKEDIKAINRVCVNLEHLIDGLKGIKNDGKNITD